MNQRMPDWLVHRAAAMPDTEALVTEEGELTYRDLDDRVQVAAGGLRALGVQPGDRVALVATNSLQFVVAVHAVARTGAVLVPINIRLTAAEVASQLARVHPSIILCDEMHAALAHEAAGLAELSGVVGLPIAGAPPADPVVTHGPNEDLCIIHTSGTTGAARGAVLTYGNFWASAAGSAYNLGVLPGDRWLACMPLFHVGGLSILLRSAIYGTSAVVHPGFDAGRVARAIREDRISLLSVVATMLQRILDEDPGSAPDHLRAVLVGGGPVPPDLLRRALERGYPVVQTYGLTECASQVTTLSPADATRRLGSAGKPLVTTEVRVDAEAGQPGEILVRGPIVMAGYYDDTAATARAIRDGWFHTGDIGRLDDDGFLTILDRRDDLIVSGGENVYPAEVEAALLAHPAISGAAVVGLSDAQWGQVVAAGIVAEGEVSLADIQGALKGRIASYKMPRVIARLDSLPTTSSGKTQRHLVREILARNRDGETG